MARGSWGFRGGWLGVDSAWVMFARRVWSVGMRGDEIVGEVASLLLLMYVRIRPW